MRNKYSSNQKKYFSKNPLQNYFLGSFLKNLSLEIGDLSDKTVLDAGTGEALALRYILRKSKSWPSRVVGVDSSKRALEIARENVKEAEFLVGDLTELPFPDSSFDVIICLEVLEHIVDYKQAVSEIVRVANKDLFLSVPWEPFFVVSSFLSGKHLKNFGRHPDHINFWTKNGFRKLFNYHDLQVVSHQISFPWQILHLSK